MKKAIIQFKRDPSGAVGAGIMMIFALIALERWHESHRIYFALLALRDSIFAIFLLRRQAAEASGTKGNAALAYAASFLPLCYLVPSSYGVVPLATANLLSILGFSIAALAAIELGDRIGVSPAKRGEICRTGIYRVLKHPMYVGYAIAELGWVLINPINILIYVVSIAMQTMRARIESRVLLSAPIQLIGTDQRGIVLGQAEKAPFVEVQCR